MMLGFSTGDPSESGSYQKSIESHMRLLSSDNRPRGNNHVQPFIQSCSAGVRVSGRLDVTYKMHACGAERTDDGGRNSGPVFQGTVPRFSGTVLFDTIWYCGLFTSRTFIHRPLQHTYYSVEVLLISLIIVG